MYFEIYADSFFLLQFFLNLYLLGAVNHMLYHTVTGRRILLGAALGAVCALFPFLIPIKLLYSVPISFLLSMIVMSVFTFRSYKGAQIKVILEKMLIATLLLGGLLTFLLKLLPKERLFSRFLWVLALGAVCYVVTRHLIKKPEEESIMCKVSLEEGCKRMTVNALLDTGNSLVEPISSKPVAVLEEAVFKELFEGKEPRGYRIIPYHSVGKTNGILEGYLLTRMIVELQGVQKECREVYVAVSKEGILSGKEYQMILNPGVLKEERGKVG